MTQYAVLAFWYAGKAAENPGVKEFDVPLETVQRAAEWLLRTQDPPTVAQRMEAVRAIAKAGNLDLVPHLIRALDDPKPEVARAARDVLRRWARKPAGLGMPSGRGNPG